MKWKLIPILMLLLAACVDKIEFPTPDDAEQFVVEGMISDQPGPYTLMLSKTFSNRLPSHSRIPVTGAQVDLYEDDMRIDTFIEQGDGVYRTSPATLGRVGHSYHIVINKNDGTQYVSEPERMIASGDFTNVVHEFQSASPNDRFNIYIDSRPAEADSYTRWRVNGTYRVVSSPEKAIATLPSLVEVPAPLPCSGWVWDGYNLYKVGPCTCCECWITDSERSIHLGDPYLRTSDGYQHVKVGEVQITPRTFYDKYHLEIEQLSMTANAYEYFRQLKGQLDGVGSLFQPSFGEIGGNISSNDPDEKVLGFFWATSIMRKTLFLYKSDVPYEVPPIDMIPDNCNVVGKSTYSIPDFWQ